MDILCVYRITSNAFDSGAPVATAGTTAEQLFGEYLDSLKSLLDGSLETFKYEDRCRSLLGTNSYILFTMDKLIARLIKQIQTVFHPNGNTTMWLSIYYHLLLKNRDIHEWLYYHLVWNKVMTNNVTTTIYRMAHIPNSVIGASGGVLQCSVVVTKKATTSDKSRNPYGYLYATTKTNRFFTKAMKKHKGVSNAKMEQYPVIFTYRQGKMCYLLRAIP